jgi:hypothetical protein
MDGVKPGQTIASSGLARLQMLTNNWTGDEGALQQAARQRGDEYLAEVTTQRAADPQEKAFAGTTRGIAQGLSSDSAACVVHYQSLGALASGVSSDFIGGPVGLAYASLGHTVGLNMIRFGESPREARQVGEQLAAAVGPDSPEQAREVAQGIVALSTSGASDTNIANLQSVGFGLIEQLHVPDNAAAITSDEALSLLGLSAANVDRPSDARALGHAVLNYIVTHSPVPEHREAASEAIRRAAGAEERGAIAEQQQGFLAIAPGFAQGPA